jgi:hypothetical protein
MALTQTNGVPSYISGNTVIAFQHAKQFRKNPHALDIPTTATYMEGQDDITHLGELGFFGQRTTAPKPFTIDILENRKVMNVGASGMFTYDTPFTMNDQCVTTRDTSADQEQPGQDGTSFKLVLSDEFKPGDVLTTDFYGEDSQQIYVDFDEQVIQVGDSFEHVMKLNTNDRKEWYSASNLMEGIQYFKAFNMLGGERDTFLSGISLPSKSSMITSEFRIGTGSGVELSVSAAANLQSNKASTAFTEGMMTEFGMSYNSFSEKFGDITVTMDYDPKTKKAIPGTERLCSVAEWLIKREHMRLIDNRAMFSKAARVETSNGHFHVAEGLWWQLKRGKNIKYARPGGITRKHIQEATEYVFQGNPMRPEDREIKFKAGWYAYENVMEIFEQEFRDQQGRLANETNIYGTDGMIPINPLTAEQDDKNITLKIKTVNIGKIYLKGIGHVEVEYDASLDYLGSKADRFTSGMHPQGKSGGAYALVIWDARNQSYSNNKVAPNNTSFVEGAPDNASVYLVKREGDLLISGRTNGYYDPYSTTDVMSSGNKQRFVDFWSWDTGAAYFLADPSSFVMIELTQKARKGFN